MGTKQKLAALPADAAAGIERFQAELDAVELEVAAPEQASQHAQHLPARPRLAQRVARVVLHHDEHIGFVGRPESRVCVNLVFQCAPKWEILLASEPPSRMLQGRLPLQFEHHGWANEFHPLRPHGGNHWEGVFGYPNVRE